MAALTLFDRRGFDHGRVGLLLLPLALQPATLLGHHIYLFRSTDLIGVKMDI